MKAVLIYFNPKDLPEVLEEFNKIESIDKILFCYFSYPLVIAIAKAWLTYHPEYTHVMIASTDLIVKEKNIVRMLDTAGDYGVICGVSNVENNDFRFLTICRELPIKNIDYRQYKWLRKRKQGIIKISHSGFSLICVKREIILKEGFWDAPLQVSMDLNFSYRCYENEIDIYCDTENIMKHLRHQGKLKIGPINSPTIREFIIVKL